MPQDRSLLQHNDTLRVERVVQHASSARWSACYQVATPRLVLPASGATEFRVAGQSVLVDGLTALSLTADLPYQMKPCADAVRTSIVVSAQPGAGHVLPPSDTWALSPRAVWLLRRHWRAIALGHHAGEGDASTQALLQTVLRQSPRVARTHGRAVPAVQRAQRFMVVRIGAAGAAPWTLNDVADAACCSLFHLARSFRKHTGFSLHGYRQRLRLAAALQRLEDGERDLAALAHDLGYSSQSHLGSAFVQDIGVTPAQARRVLRA